MCQLYCLSLMVRLETRIDKMSTVPLCNINLVGIAGMLLHKIKYSSRNVDAHILPIYIFLLSVYHESEM